MKYWKVQPMVEEIGYRVIWDYDYMMEVINDYEKKGIKVTVEEIKIEEVYKSE